MYEREIKCIIRNFSFLFSIKSLFMTFAAMAPSPLFEKHLIGTWIVFYSALLYSTVSKSSVEWTIGQDLNDQI